MKPLFSKIFMLLLFPIYLSAQSTEDYTLEKCVAFALENNSQIKNAHLETDISKANIGEVRAAGLPQITGDVSFVHNIAIQTAFLPDFISPVTYQVLQREGLIESIPSLDSPPLPARFGTDYTGLAGISVRQLVFDGSYFVALKASNTYKEVADKELVKTKIEIVESVQKSFYAVLVAQENLELLATNYYRIDSLLNETRILYENGFAEKIDVNRVTIERNNLRTELKSSTESLATTIAFLKYNMGMPIQQPFSIVGDINQLRLETIDIDFDGFNYLNRIEYDILQTNRDLVELDMKRFQVQYLPSINANFNAGYNSGATRFNQLTEFNNSNVWFNYSSWGLSMSLPIFDGLRKSYIIQQKKIQARQLENTRVDLQNAIDLEIMQSKINLNNSVQNLNTQLENMELAREVYDVTRIKYQEGVGSNLEVIEADAAYKAAQISYSNALYNAVIAKIELKKALGILLTEMN